MTRQEQRCLVDRALAGLRANLYRHEFTFQGYNAEEQAQIVYGIWRFSRDLLDLGQGGQVEYALMALPPKRRAALVATLYCVEQKHGSAA